MIWISLISSGHFIQMQKNISSQVLMGHFQGYATSWVTNQTSVNLRKLKSYQDLLQPQCYETRYQLLEKNSKKHKHMQIKLPVSK